MNLQLVRIVRRLSYYLDAHDGIGGAFDEGQNTKTTQGLYHDVHMAFRRML